jgi:hypothetical protein
MRSLAFVVVTVALAVAACSQTAPSTAGEGGIGEAGFEDTSPLNTCTAAGSVCKGNGVCGIGFSMDTSHLCAQSVEICCVPNVGDGSLVTPDASARDASMPDAGPSDAGHDASSRDGGMDSGMAHDAGHDASVPDAGHDSGHDSGLVMDSGGGHDAAGDVKAD